MISRNHHTASNLTIADIDKFKYIDMKNSVTLTGHLAKDPAVRELTENSVANVTIAVTDSVWNPSTSETKTKTYWHNLVFWGDLADFAKSNLKKGASVEIEGKLISRSYIDSENIKRYVTEVVVRTAREIKDNEADRADTVE